MRTNSTISDTFVISYGYIQDTSVETIQMIRSDANDDKVVAFYESNCGSCDTHSVRC